MTPEAIRDNLIKLVYDYFHNVKIPIEEQKERIDNYTGGKKTISRFIMMALTTKHNNYWDFYNEVKQKKIEDFKRVECEIKRGFFTKELIFKGNKYETL